jgi:hypothetical protein
MIKLKRIVPVLIIALAIAIGVVVMLTRQQPVPDKMSILHFEMCQPPCWIGITPGETSLDRAIIRTRQVYRTQGYTLTLKRVAINKFHLVIENGQQPFPGSIDFRTSDGQTIDAIEFNFGEGYAGSGSYTFMDSYRDFGSPSHINFWSRTNGLYAANCPVIVFDDGRIIVTGRSRTGNDLLQRQIFGITFQSQGSNLSRQIRWRGFGSINRYYAEWLLSNP